MTELSAAPSGDLRKPHPRTARRKWLFRTITALIVFAIAELLAVIGLRTASYANRSDLVTAQRMLAESGFGKGDTTETVHPYFGWSLIPGASEGVPHDGRVIPVNPYGLADDGPTFHQRGPDRFIVGITGGSVAWQMTVAGEDVLRESLSKLDALRGRRIELVRLALPGQKQPQQLMMLNWLLVEGAQFDVIVNIDGYNEAVLPIADNRAAGVNLSYPRRWDVRMREVVDPLRFAEGLELIEIRGTRQAIARHALTSPLRWSNTYQLVWLIRDLRLQRKRNELQRIELNTTVLQQRKPFALVGPHETFPDSQPEALHQAETSLWSNSSWLMHSACAANGIRYLHVLQPNQYLPGSKPLSQHEKKYFFAHNESSAALIPVVYPLMREAGKNLRQRGVHFIDATQLFQSETETIYADYFCHYNKRGSELLAAKISEAITESIHEDEPPQSIHSTESSTAPRK